MAWLVFIPNSYAAAGNLTHVTDVRPSVGCTALPTELLRRGNSNPSMQCRFSFHRATSSTVKKRVRWVDGSDGNDSTRTDRSKLERVREFVTDGTLCRREFREPPYFPPSLQPSLPPSLPPMMTPPPRRFPPSSTAAERWGPNPAVSSAARQPGLSCAVYT